MRAAVYSGSVRVWSSLALSCYRYQRCFLWKDDESLAKAHGTRRTCAAHKWKTNGSVLSKLQQPSGITSRYITCVNNRLLCLCGHQIEDYPVKTV